MLIHIWAKIQPKQVLRNLRLPSPAKQPISGVISLSSIYPHRSFLVDVMPHSVHNSTSTQTKMSRPSSTSTDNVNAFPKPAGAQLLSPEVAAGPLSPSPSQFSFAESEPLAVDASRHMRPTTRGTANGAGDLRPATSRARAQFYEDSFAYKEGHGSSARDRVTKDAPIIAELRTNVIVRLMKSALHSPHMLTRARSKTSTPWLQISPTTSPPDTKDPRLQL